MTAVIFDIGNVVLRWEPWPVLADLVGPGQLEAFRAEVDFLAWHGRQDAGRTAEAALAEARTRHPRWAEALAGFYPRWIEALPAEVPGIIEILAELRRAKRDLFAITNFPAEFWAETVAAHPVLARFQDVVVSGEVGLAKPDPAIFHLALERFGLRPEQAVFIDDTAPNVRAAAALGIDAIRFEGAPALRCALGERGLL